MRIFVCSPLRGDVAANIAVAEELCRRLALRGHTPIAPHVYCTRFLRENDAVERELGIDIGLDLLRCCEELWFHIGHDRVVTACMSLEIAEAKRLGIPVRAFDLDAPRG